jgi:hypothetical protein
MSNFAKICLDFIEILFTYFIGVLNLCWFLKFIKNRDFDLYFLWIIFRSKTIKTRQEMASKMGSRSRIKKQNGRWKLTNLKLKDWKLTNLKILEINRLDVNGFSNKKYHRFNTPSNNCFQFPKK